MIRLIRLLSVAVAALIVVTFLFAKWYTAAVSLGLVSLILGFALQNPISSLIGWFYIIIRTPYRIGDRIQVYNYSWKKFLFIWNEIPFHIAYESDLSFVESTIRETAKQELGESMADNIQRFKQLLKQTPIDELDIKEYPFIVFRTNPNTWIEVSVTYLVAPKRASAVRSRLIKSILAALLTEPSKVMFPKSNSR